LIVAVQQISLQHDHSQTELSAERQGVSVNFSEKIRALKDSVMWQ